MGMGNPQIWTLQHHVPEKQYIHVYLAGTPPEPPLSAESLLHFLQPAKQLRGGQLRSGFNHTVEKRGLILNTPRIAFINR